MAQMGTEPGQTGRVDWVDYAKGFCIVMVVMMHSTLGVDLGELALSLERGDPAAQVAEGGGRAGDGHVLGAGLQHATLYTTRAATGLIGASSCPALCRASTSFFPRAAKTWMAGTSPAMTTFGVEAASTHAATISWRCSPRPSMPSVTTSPTLR